MILKPKMVNKNSYLYIFLYSNGNRKGFLIHKLVAETFILNPKSKKYINHIDGNAFNNHASNLEWCDKSEVSTYQKSNRKKLNFSDDDINNMINLYGSNKYTLNDLAKQYGCSITTLYKILSANGQKFTKKVNYKYNKMQIKVSNQYRSKSNQLCEGFLGKADYIKKNEAVTVKNINSINEHYSEVIFLKENKKKYKMPLEQFENNFEEI